MTYEEFQKHYEEDGDKVYRELSKLSEQNLLQFIGREISDKYQIWEGKDNYQIWRVLESKGTQKSIKPLFEIVSNLQNNYLVRYHACTALFAIAGIRDDDFKGQIQYGLDKDKKPVDRGKAIEKLKNILEII